MWTIISGTIVINTVKQMETRNMTMFYNRNDRIYGINISIKQYAFCNRNKTFEIFTHIQEANKFEGYYLNNISINHCIGFKLC